MFVIKRKKNREKKRRIKKHPKSEEINFKLKCQIVDSLIVSQGSRGIGRTNNDLN
jgi:hypothetical protein